MANSSAAVPNAQALAAEYGDLIRRMASKVPKAGTDALVREIAVMCGQATFIYNFASAARLDVRWAHPPQSKKPLHEEAIHKLWLGYSIGVGYTDSETKKKKFIRWLETGEHERWCLYKNRYLGADLQQPTLTCEVVEKRMKKWGFLSEGGNKARRQGARGSRPMPQHH